MGKTKKYDVVVGGGFAGFGAAIGSAKAGARTMLIEATGACGGLGVNGLVNPFMKYDYHGENLVQGVFHELVERLQDDSAYAGRAFSYEAVKYHMVELLQKNNVDILLYHQVVGLEKKERKISKVKVYSFGKFTDIKADLYIDCTGDSILGKLADLTLFCGDEESRKNQAMTQMFVLARINLAKTMDYVRKNPDDFFNWVNPQEVGIATSIAGFFNLIKKAKNNGLNLPSDHFFFIRLPEKDAVVVNTGHILVDNANNPATISEAQITGLKQTRNLTIFAQKYLPGFEDCYLRQTAVQVGIRESAKIKGEYVFSQSDVENFAKFDDAVAKGIYGVNIHENENKENNRNIKLNYSDYYEIPARFLISSELNNLLMAGRNLSADFGGQSAVRIMPSCCGMGQGAGVIAALAAKKRKKPVELLPAEFQGELKRQGANL